MRASLDEAVVLGRAAQRIWSERSNPPGWIVRTPLGAFETPDRTTWRTADGAWNGELRRSRNGHHIYYLDVFFPDGAHPAEGGLVGSPRSARSSHRRRQIAVCRSTSRGQPRSTASSISCCSQASRARSRGAYSLVVKNLEQRR